MTPARLAAIHASAFERPWDAGTFEGLLDQPGVELFSLEDAFVLIRVAADEAEILTLAVDNARRRSGLGRRLVEGAADLARARGAATLFLEVAEDNAPALALYRATGFEQSGRRKAYYPRQAGPPVAALLFSLNLSR